MLLEKNFTIVDVETTGGSPFFNRVIEVGLLRVEKGEVVEEYQTLLNPEMDIPEFITNLTGITPAAVASAPTFAELADEILAKFEDAIFVAHNSQFDYGFLKEEFRRLGYGFDMQQLCTVRLSRALYKEHKHHNLTALIERYQFECANRHRAFDDAKVLWDFLQHVHTDIDPEVLQKVLRRMIREPRISRAANGAVNIGISKPKMKLQTGPDGILHIAPVIEELIYETETGETINLD
jgi:DNA polymerase III subunit epsilon